MRATLVALWLAGCATTPDPIRDTADGPPLADVVAAPERFAGERVRWGGTIASVENRAEETRVYVVARELYPSGRPRPADVSSGRFVALLPGFHDPVIFAPGRELTAVGVLQAATTARIGEFEYLYPVLSAETHRLWPRRETYPPYVYPPYPYYYHDPWYPYPYPYYLPRHVR